MQQKIYKNEKSEEIIRALNKENQGYLWLVLKQYSF